MEISEIVLNVVFYVFAAIVVCSAVAVAWNKNIVRSAFSLLGVLFGAAALYAIMKADFIAAAQILIYVGGIMVLIIFAIMLTHRITDVKVSNESTPGPAARYRLRPDDTTEGSDFWNRSLLTIEREIMILAEL